MATVMGGGVTTYINVGSNDVGGTGLGQSLANIITAGLSNGTYTRTNGPAPSTGKGVLTISSPNSSVTNQAGVSVDLVAASQAGFATTGETVAGSGGTIEALLGDNENITYNTGGGSGTVVTGDGNNFIGTPGTANGTASFSITTGTGNDTIIAGTGTNTVSAGLGNNFVFTGNGTDTVYSAGALDTISGVSGTAGLEDTVFQTGGSILVGSFAKNLLFVGSNSTATVLAGNGSYTVNGGQGANLIAGGTAGNNFLGGGTGSVGSTIFGGGNGDLLLARGTGVNELVAGAGNETLSGAGASGGNYFFTATGAAAATANTSILGGSGADVYFAGGGHSTIDTGYGGADIVAIVNGRAGGAVVLNNFQVGTQKVELQGYGGSELSNDLSNQRNVNGSATLTLSDNTTITFSGIGQVGQNAFG